jgi:hypothetical protein
MSRIPPGPQKGRDTFLQSNFERRLFPLAQRTLVRFTHPLDVCETADVARRYQTVMQHLEVSKREERWYMVVLHV